MIPAGSETALTPRHHGALNQTFACHLLQSWPLRKTRRQGAGDACIGWSCKWRSKIRRTSSIVTG